LLPGFVLIPNPHALLQAQLLLPHTHRSWALSLHQLLLLLACMQHCWL
jgi:hypothetical protein